MPVVVKHRLIAKSLAGRGGDAPAPYADECTARWTFASGPANAAIAHELGSRLDAKMMSDNFTVRFPPGRSVDEVEREIRRLADADPGSLRAPVRESAREELKFADCLPAELADHVIRERLADPAAVANALRMPMRVVSSDRE